MRKLRQEICGLVHARAAKREEVIGTDAEPRRGRAIEVFAEIPIDVVTALARLDVDKGDVIVFEGAPVDGALVSRHVHALNIRLRPRRPSAADEASKRKQPC